MKKDKHVKPFSLHKLKSKVRLSVDTNDVHSIGSIIATRKRKSLPTGTPVKSNKVKLTRKQIFLNVSTEAKSQPRLEK